MYMQDFNFEMCEDVKCLVVVFLSKSPVGNRVIANDYGLDIEE